MSFLKCIGILSILHSFVSLTQNLPEMRLKQSFPITGPNSLENSECIQFEMTQSRLFRLDKRGAIQSWLKDGTGYIKSQYGIQSNNIKEFNLVNNQNEIIFLTSLKNYVVLESSSLSVLEQGQFSIQIQKVTKTSKNQFAAISNLKQQSFSDIFFGNIGNPVQFSSHISWYLKNDSKIKFNPEQTLAYLISSSDEIVTIDIRDQQTQYNVQDIIKFKGTTAQSPKHIIFSPDGTRGIIWSEASDIVSFLATPTQCTFLVQTVFQFDIKGIHFSNDNSTIAVLHESYISYYETDTLNLLERKNGLETTDFVKLDVQNKKVFESTPRQINVYQLVCPHLFYFSQINSLECNAVTPIAHCQKYDTLTGLCKQCQSGMNLSPSGYLCEEIKGDLIQNSPNNTLSTQPECIPSMNCKQCQSTSQTLSNATSKCKQCNQGYYMSKQEDTQCVQLPASRITSISFITLDFMTPILQKIMMFIQMFPLIRFFLQFVNYWNLSCLYQLLNMDIPFFLKKVNLQINRAVNLSFGEFFGWSELPYRLSQKTVSDIQLEEFGAEMDFIKSNFENIIYLLILGIGLIFLHFLRKKFDEKSKIYSFLRMNKLQILGGQTVGFVATLFLSERDIIYQIGSCNIKEKINTAIVFTTMLAASLLPVFYLWILISKNSSKEKETSLKENSQRKLKKSKHINFFKNNTKSKSKFFNYFERKTFWLYFINVSIPVTALLPTVIPFFCLNTIVLGFILFDAFQSTQYRVNNIILSCYFMVYHLMYLVIFISDNFWVDYYAGIACLLCFLVGGIHDLLTFFTISIYEVYLSIRAYWGNFISKRKSNSEILRSNSRKSPIVVRTKSLIRKQQEFEFQENSEIIRRPLPSNSMKHSKFDKNISMNDKRISRLRFQPKNFQDYCIENFDTPSFKKSSFSNVTTSTMPSKSEIAKTILENVFPSPKDKISDISQKQKQRRIFKKEIKIYAKRSMSNQKDQQPPQTNQQSLNHSKFKLRQKCRFRRRLRQQSYLTIIRNDKLEHLNDQNY